VTYNACARVVWFVVRSTQDKVLSATIEKSEQREMHMFAAALKVMGTYHQNDCLQLCRELCGGMGYHAENRIGVLLSEWHVHLTVDGTNLMLFQQVAKSVLDSHRELLMDSEQREAFQRKMHGERAALAQRFASSSWCADHEFLVALFSHRLSTRMLEVAAELQTHVMSGKGGRHAWDLSMDRVWALSLAWGELQVVLAFARALQKGVIRHAEVGGVDVWSYVRVYPSHFVC
jgi:Acyl-CoA oxidase, C-alpha1 domain